MYRQLAIAGLVVLAAGCLGGPAADGEPSTGATVTAGSPDPNVTVQPGDTATITVEATDVSELRVGRISDENVTIDFTSATLSPRPDRVYETLPPYWWWEDRQSTVTVELPIQADSGATPGIYRTTAAIYHSENHSHENATEIPIVVEVGG
ncbi:COG1361 family protein [Halococcoides cellulosivorans]|uniref:Uncharacterized protein n=1 Tax=Halococcoides cellulosivorans TaxID=1679096 RepID=A0A2R4WXP9_9EURY|nr:hypothetical protein [Halococcoides cellulosivorans]AWB26315.1 hypothetical protein HARCEL1_00560 [Halococcoides cellulosivorans]